MTRIKKRRIHTDLLLLTAFLCLLAGCSTTKNLPEGETLYVGVKNINVINEDKTPAGVQTLEEVEAALSYPPNNAILGSNSLRFPIPFGLWIYNDFVKYQSKSSNQPAARLWFLQWFSILFGRHPEESPKSKA